MTSLGIDIGSSSVKVSLMDIATGECVALATLPQQEMPIEAPKPGWAEQDPSVWMQYVCEGIIEAGKKSPLSNIRSIGITYQMHGLVCMDRQGEVLRKSIIWCDSRAVETGAQALERLGRDYCLERTLNSPGNFTASKLAWVKRNEPDIFARTDKFFLPGDYIVYRLSGDISTTFSGLSEQILWNFRDDCPADFIAGYYGIELSSIPPPLPSIGIQAHTGKEIEKLLGIPCGTPISYRAGDQPNNAFSLNVMNPGEIAATGGTSGVVYGVTDRPKADPLSRVNTFLHVNHKAGTPRYGTLLCINGTGILNAWARRLFAYDMSYGEINDLCAGVPAGSDGVIMLPFGNGAERMLENRCVGASISNIDLNRHSKGDILRAAQEGIAFAFRYGIDIMKESGLKPKVIRAGKANLFLSPLFRTVLATLCDATIELYNTDGALGAARGAALGAGLFRDEKEAFASLKELETVQPEREIKAIMEERYAQWKNELLTKLKQ